MLSRQIASRSLLRSALSVSSPRTATPSIPSTRSITQLASKAYTAHAEATGQGRNGTAKLVNEDSPFEVKLAMPKALGGSGDGLNPEQLFSLGYSACFLSALNLTARSNGITLPPNVRIEAQVSIGKPESEEEHGPPFGIAVDLHVKSDAKNEAHRQTLEEAVHKAHEICPYSQATRNNIPVNIIFD